MSDLYRANQLIMTFPVPETYAPALLRQRAARLSKITGKYYRAPMDAEKELDIKSVFLRQLSLPWLLLFQEPIVLIISIYMAIIYVSALASSDARPALVDIFASYHRVHYTCSSPLSRS